MKKYIRIYYVEHTWRAELGWNDDSTRPPQSVHPSSSTTRLGTGNVTRVGTENELWIYWSFILYLYSRFSSLSLFLLSQVDAACTSSSWLLFSFLISKLPVCWPSRRKGSSSMWKMWRCLLLLRDQLLLLQEIYRFLFISWFYSSIELGTGWTRREINPEWKRYTNDKFQLWINFLLISPPFRANHLFRPAEKGSASIEKNSLSIIGNTSYAQVLWTGRSIGPSESRKFFFLFCRRKMLRAMKHYIDRSDSALAWHSRTRQTSRGYLATLNPFNKTTDAVTKRHISAS